MRRIRCLVVLAALGVLCALPATAAAATTYTLTGIELNASPATFAGSLVGQLGSWRAVVQHDPLSYTGTTAITGGTFTISTLLPAVQTTGTVDRGTIVAGRISSPNGITCTQTFALTGTLNGGTGAFAGVLTHYGILFGGRCNALAASFTGRPASASAPATAAPTGSERAVVVRSCVHEGSAACAGGACVRSRRTCWPCRCRAAASSAPPSAEPAAPCRRRSTT